MSTFTTRVELYGSPSKETYDKLHAAMMAKKFHRQISENNILYDLPHAEYISDHSLTTSQVKKLAIDAASTVWKDFAVLTTGSTVVWEIYNLKKSS